MAVCDRPVLLAISRVLQCVLLAGMDSSVLVTTASTFLSVIERGAPGRGSSNKPSSRFYAESFAPLANRCSGNLQSLGDSAITQAFVTSEHNPGSHGHGLSRLRAPSQHREFFPLFRGHVEGPGRASDTHTSSMRVSLLLFNVFLTQNTSRVRKQTQCELTDLTTAHWNPGHPGWMGSWYQFSYEPFGLPFPQLK